MELGLDREPLIDPEVRAFIFSLASALGGSDVAGDGHYVLGDDALAVLKDIKRWLRLYDDKTNRLDVARLLAEANLVRGDLLEILASWPDDAAETSFKSKVALYCVDLLTQLTWPIEKNEEELSTNHLLHLPFLQAAQVSYKRAALQHETAEILRKAVRICLPPLAISRSDRTPHEENIIKVVLYFLRNVAMIGQPRKARTEEEDIEISRSATIDAFHYQDVLSLLLTIGSGLGEEFDLHDVELLDIVYHLVKGVDVDRLFMETEELVSANTRHLQDLIAKEKAMLVGYSRHAPSRHNRFMPILWVKRDGEKSNTLMGQSAFATDNATMHEMDKKKKWRKPRRTMVKKNADLNPEHIRDDVPLASTARRHLRDFVSQFLDSSFNPLFFSVRKAIEREANRVLGHHVRQYFYLISWFLRAETARRRNAGEVDKSGKPSADVGSFGLVAAVLNQETFVLLNRHMQTAQDYKDWSNLTACMQCFTQILTTVQEMLESPLEEDQEIADNILSRIFYEQTTHDRVIFLLRSYKDQGVGYLDAVTNLSHVFLRLLERYSKQNVDMQVRRIRRVRKKKAQEDSGENTAFNPIEDRDNHDRDVQEAQKITTERKFDFTRFAARFINQNSVDTFVAFLRLYKDLNEEQLKRTHRFFHRIAFKMDMSVLLMRVDIIALINNVIKGPNAIDLESKVRKEWEELARQLFKLLLKKLERTPALAVELLFSKLGSSVFYLEHGFDQDLPKRTFRCPAELEVKPGMDHAQQLGVAVSVLINQGKSHLLSWAKSLLATAADERGAWEAEAITQKPQTPAELQPVTQTGTGNSVVANADNAEENPETANLTKFADSDTNTPAPPISISTENEEHRIAASRDKHLRLLFVLLGFQNDLPINGTPDSQDEFGRWNIPSSLSSHRLREDLALVNRFEYELPTFEDGKGAEDFLRRKVNVRERATQQNKSDALSDDDVDESLSDIEARLFAAGGPDIRPNDWEPATKLNRRRLRRIGEEGGASEAVLAERRKAKRQRELERARKVKSALYVSKSDDESDEERDKAFFEEEARQREKTRAGHAAAVKNALMSGKSKVGRKEKRKIVEDDGKEDESDGQRRLKRARNNISNVILDDSDANSEENNQLPLPDADSASDSTESEGDARMSDGDDSDTDTPPSSQRPSSGHGPNTDIARQDHGSDNLDGSDKENFGARPTKKQDRKGLLSRRRAVVESDSDE